MVSGYLTNMTISSPVSWLTWNSYSTEDVPRMPRNSEITLSTTSRHSASAAAERIGDTISKLLKSETGLLKERAILCAHLSSPETTG